jgi:hypothetical protein
MISSLKIKTLGLCLIAVLATGAAGVSSAFAAHNPEFRWCQEREKGKFTDNECSKEGTGKWELLGKLNIETVGLAAKAAGSQKFTLTVSGVKITVTCKTVKLREGRIFGGEGEGGKNGGAGEGAIVFEECELEGATGCAVEEKKIETAPLLSNLAFETQEAAEKHVQEIGGVSRAVIWVRPKLETESKVQVFVPKFTIAGSPCVIKGTYEIITQQNPSHDCCLGRKLGRPEFEHAEAHEVEFGSTHKTFWLNEEKPTEWTVAELKLRATGSPEVKWEGKLAFTLEGKDHWWEVE